MVNDTDPFRSLCIGTRLRLLASLAVLVAILPRPALGAEASSNGGRTTTLAISGDGRFFTINGTPTFLNGLSYYGAQSITTPSHRTADLDDMAADGFNWIRVWVYWKYPKDGEDFSVMTRDGVVRPVYMKRLKTLIAECDERGIIVDCSLNRDAKGGWVGARNQAEHLTAVRVLAAELRPYRNVYIDVSNERDVRDGRFVSLSDCGQLIDAVKSVDPDRLCTASGVPHSQNELSDYKTLAHMDFITPHLCRNAECPAKTVGTVKRFVQWMDELGWRVPIHLQEPFRRGYGRYAATVEDFYRDCSGAKVAEAAGWCLHNGGNARKRPHRCFNMGDREGRLYAQWDRVEQTVVANLDDQTGGVSMGVRRYQAEYDEQLTHKTGRRNGLTWSANVATHEPGYLSDGPGIDAVPPGRHTVAWRMKIDNNAANSDTVVTIDVVRDGGTAGPAKLDIKRTDFRAPDKWQVFTLAFDSKSGDRLSFRTYWRDRAKIDLDWITLSIGSGQSAARRTGALVRNGWLVHGDRMIWGWVQHNGWWRPGQRPNLTRRSLGDPLGDVRPNRTEDLDKLTDHMLRYGYPGFEHNYGLWYDRRRDAHDTAPRNDANVQPPFLEQPWARGDTGTAADGLPKYDLTRFNPWYFERLKAFADLCDRKGTVLFHKYYMQHALLETQAHYVDFPWRPANCIQNTGMPVTTPAADAFYDVSHPARRALHRLYIRKCLDTLGDNTNVVHLTGQEYTGPRPFVEFWMDTILEWQDETGKRVTIGLGAPKDVQDAVLADAVRGAAVDVLDMRYWWFRADGSLHAPRGGRQMPGRGYERGSKQAKETNARQIYRKVRAYRNRYPAKAIIDAIEVDRREHWAFFMAGGSMLVRGGIAYPDFGDPTEYVKPINVDIVLPSYRLVREHMATRLPKMRPADIVTGNPENTWCLAEPNRTYLAYSLEGGTIRLNLTGANGTFDANWFDPRTGERTAAGTVAASPTVALETPDRKDWALWLERKTP